jgi:hypothetical protein
MPLSVERSVRKENIKFLHNRIHYSQEYFIFMKRLVQSNVQFILTTLQQHEAPSYVICLFFSSSIIWLFF